MTVLNEVVMELVNIEKELKDIRIMLKDLMTLLCVNVDKHQSDICDDY